MNSINEAHLVEIFLESILGERGLSKNSASSYLNDLKNFIIYFNHQGISVASLQTNQIIQYLSSDKLKKYKNTTVARKISTIRQFYLFLLSEKYITTNPAQDLEHPKKEVRLPKALSKDEISTLLSIAAQDETFEGIRNYCLLEILYSTGMRISELLELKIAVILNPTQKNEEGQALIIKGKGNRDRLIIFNNKALQALDKYLAARAEFMKNTKSDYLFPSRPKKGKDGHLARQTFFIALKRIATAAGIAIAKISPHKLRHSFASHILQNGASLRIVQELLGHNDIASTQIYTKVGNDQARDLVLQKHPLAKVDD